MNNNTNFPTQGFAWSLNNIKMENEIPYEQQQPQNNNNNSYALTEADLYQLLLGDEAQQQQQQQFQQQQCPMLLNESICGDSSSTSEDLIIQEKAPKKVKKNKPNDNKPPASSTGRLDFRPIHDCIPESQLKAMTSKERRQLRNKISARNFRNRRKEYIGNLEDELNQQKAENSQLKLEIKWLKNNMEKVQKENDRLRIELMLGTNNTISSESDQSTSPPPQPVMDTQLMTTATETATAPSYILDSTSLINSSMNLSSFTNPSCTSSDESSSLPSPPNLFTNFPENWDFVLPNDTFLSHALVPNWNFNHVLKKETSSMVQSPNMLQQYPLLAPALMSIVLHHTMTMSTDDLLATARLSPPSVATFIPYDKKYPFTSSNMMSQKEARAVWDMLEPLQHMKERNEKIKKQNKKANTMVLVRHNEAGEEEFCPMTWLRTSALKYLLEVVAAVSSDVARQQPLLVRQQNIQEIQDEPQQEEDPLKKKFILCRKYQEAVRYITASS